MKNIVNSIRFNFLYVDQYSFGRTWVYPESRIPYNMLRYIVSGKAKFRVNGEEFEVSKNQIVYVPQGCMLFCKVIEDNLSFISIRFTASVHYEGGDFLAEYFGVPRITYECQLEGSEYFEKIFHWAKTDSSSKMFRIQGYLELLIAYLIERTSLNEDKLVKMKKHELKGMDEIREKIEKSQIRQDSRIQIVVDHMVLHPTEQYTTEWMCEMAELSESQFRKLFKNQTGKSPGDFLRDIRITAAARKLLVSNETVSNIAYEVGYEDPNYFVRIFKKAFGLTPNQYRNTARE